jgi:hypothetical protein
MFERELGDGWKLALSGGELVLRYGLQQIANVDEDGVFETCDYNARIPIAVLAAFTDAALEWRMHNG